MFNFTPQTAQEGAILVSDDVIYKLAVGSDLSKADMPVAVCCLVYIDSIENLAVRITCATRYAEKAHTLDFAP